MTTPQIGSRSHTFGREQRVAIVRALAALPAVQQVGFLQFFGVQQFFVKLAPHSAEAAADAEAAVRSVTDVLHPEIATKVTCRVLAAGEPLPSSAIDYARPA